MSEELKPCPHCSGTAFLDDEPHAGGVAHVACRECRAGGPPCYGPDRARLARTAWNRRASPWRPIESAKEGDVALVFDPSAKQGRWNVAKLVCVDTTMRFVGRGTTVHEPVLVWMGLDNRRFNPTHWTPLPEPPEGV